MPDLQERFEKAQAEVKTLPAKPGNDDLLTLYSLYKQATEGDASGGKKPGRFDLVGKAKYDAWTKVSGMTSDDAKQHYVELVDGLIGR